MLRQRADREVPDDLERPRVDHVDRVAVAVRDVDPRARAADGRAEHVRPVGGVDVHEAARSAGRAEAAPRRRSGRPQHGGTVPGGVPAPGDEDAVAERDGGEVGGRRREPARAADAPQGDVDGDDARRRRSRRGAAAAEDEGGPAERRRGRMGRRRRQAADPKDTARRGDVLEHGVAGGAVLLRAAGNDQPAPDRGDGGVADGEGRCATTRAPLPGRQATIVSSQRVPV